MFGEVFKKLRKSKHITLEAISKDVISTSQLSRWENGLSDISLNKLIILLNRINVSPQEFIAMTIPENNETNNFLKNLSLLYSEKDSISIYRIFLKNIAAYHHTNNVDYLFHASAAANVLFDIKNKNYLTPQDQ
ncbi:helix-turn-helix domain-containing protein [Lactobacillus delbrueckii]